MIRKFFIFLQRGFCPTDYKIHLQVAGNHTENGSTAIARFLKKIKK